jgi:Ca-activated chloride channel family protein
MAGSPKPRVGSESRRTRLFPTSRKNFLFVFWAELVLVGCLEVPQVSSAQSQPLSSPSSESSTILVGARLKDGAPTELSPSEIEIKSDKKIATITDVHRAAEGALNYALVFDTSGGQRKHFTQQRDEAVQILSKLVQSGRDHGILVAFSDQPFLDADGIDPRKFIKALAGELPRGSTALYDAVVASVDPMSKIAPDQGRRVMFILSDGEDNSSHMSQEAALSALLQAGIRVYVIGQKNADANVSSRQIDRDANTLKEFAQGTGGKVYFPAKEEDVDKIIADMVAELANLFSVSYTLSGQPADGRVHKLQVKCSKKDISITAPDRYYTSRP